MKKNNQTKAVSTEKKIMPRATTQEKAIPISEIFGPTIQGEGELIGTPTVFVRVGGCDYRCQWCDTPYAVKPQYRPTWQKMDSAAIFAKIEALSQQQPILITLSGGNPALYDFEPLIKQAKAKGYRLAMETQGSIAKPYMAQLDYLTISPKPPSSLIPFDPVALQQVVDAHSAPQLKIVVADERDYQFARRIAKKYPHLPLTLQPCNLQADPSQTPDLAALNTAMKWLIEKTTHDAWYNVRILPQLHVLIWHNERGV